MADNQEDSLEYLRKLGLKPEVRKTEEGVAVRLRDPVKNRYWDIPFEEDKTYSSMEALKPSNTYVPDHLKKKGIATNAYRVAEEFTGKKIVPDDVQSEDAMELHEKRGYGKKFGISEDDLEKALSPEDLQLRKDRKEIFLKALERVRDNAKDHKTTEPYNLLNNAIKPAFEEVKKTPYDPKVSRSNILSVLENAIHSVRHSANPAAELAKNAGKYASKIKSVAGPSVGLGAALMAGSASDALAEVVPGGVEDVGKGSDKALLEAQERDVELVRDTRKEDKLSRTKLEALKRMLEK